jgi:hypothetical protein
VVVKNVLDEIDNDQLVVHVVWTPVLKPDNYESAVKAQFQIRDERAVHYWDGDKELGSAYGKVVPLPNGRKFAWDIYFAYAEGVKWEDKPPEPADWVHQLGRDERQLKNGDRLRESVLELLNSAN